MDPISLGLGIVGMGMQLFGGMKASGIAKQQAAVSQDMAQQEQGINNLKQQQMQLESRRGQLQNFRNAQRLRAQATAAAVQGGAQFGSGLQGGIADIENTATENSLGINQASSISSGIFNFNNKISADKMQMASLGGDMASAQALSSLGGSMVKSGPMIGGQVKDFMQWAKS